MFQSFLMYKNPLLDDPLEEEQTGPVESLQAAILENVSIYAEKYDEEFKMFFGPTVSAVWNLLVGWGDKGKLPKYDIIISSAMKFLAGVVSKEFHKDVFAAPDTLLGICRNVAIPNLVIRENDEEVFEDNPVRKRLPAFILL